MRNKFDSQLEKLNLELITMGALCEDAISASVKGFLDDDDALCRKAVEAEDEINRKERDIESICMKLLLEQQPVARDLRVISSALKMISDMERIGDQAYDIAEIAKFIKNSNVKSKIHIKDMAAAAAETQAIAAGTTGKYIQLHQQTHTILPEEPDSSGSSTHSMSAPRAFSLPTKFS